MDFTYRQEQILMKIFADHAAWTTDQIAAHNAAQENEPRIKAKIGIAPGGSLQDGREGAPLFTQSGLRGSGMLGGRIIPSRDDH